MPKERSQNMAVDAEKEQPMIDKWDVEILKRWLKLAQTEGTDRIKIVAGPEMNSWIVRQVDSPEGEKMSRVRQLKTMPVCPECRKKCAGLWHCVDGKMRCSFCVRDHGRLTGIDPRTGKKWSGKEVAVGQVVNADGEDRDLLAELMDVLHGIENRLEGKKDLTPEEQSLLGTVRRREVQGTDLLLKRIEGADET